MHIVFSQTAVANGETYRDRDPSVWAEVRAVLEAIERGLPRARETALRMPGGTAWSVTISVPGRDETYQVIWAEIAHTGRAYVAHIGPTLS